MVLAFVFWVDWTVVPPTTSQSLRKGDKQRCMVCGRHYSNVWSTSKSFHVQLPNLTEGSRPPFSQCFIQSLSIAVMKTVGRGGRMTHESRISKPKAESGDGVLGEGAASPSPPAMESRGAMRSPGGVRGGARPSKSFPLFSAPRMASPDTIISLIVDHKNEKFLFHSVLTLESVIVHLIYALWCF